MVDSRLGAMMSFRVCGAWLVNTVVQVVRIYGKYERWKLNESKGGGFGQNSISFAR